MRSFVWVAFINYAIIMDVSVVADFHVWIRVTRRLSHIYDSMECISNPIHLNLGNSIFNPCSNFNGQ